jgi:predicted Zn-dependent protease with MMP-like domain/Tfp pilus assembly protein PilF
MSPVFDLEEQIALAWHELEDGDVAEARRLGLLLREGAPDAPEVSLLLSAVALEEGDDAEGLAELERAAALDPEWAEPELRAAELLADQGELEQALRRASRAQALADEEEELLDAVAVKASLELELDRVAAARKTLASLPPAAASNASADLGRELGQLSLAVGDGVAARVWFERAIAIDREDADAWHGLGLAAEALGDEEGKRRAWLETLALDTGSDGDYPERLSEAEMAEVAEAALGELPARARRLLADVPILIADRPARKDVATGLDPRLLGLFTGSAYPENSALGSAPQLTQILLFRSNLEHVAKDEEELRSEIRTTLLHETGHFFGMSEDDLDEVGLG